MKTSQKGIDLIKKFEGCKLTAYQDSEGVWTIGYGHTGNVKQGQTITSDYAETLLRNDLIKFELKVSKYDLQYVWNQNEFDALVSFAFNIGNIDQLTDMGKRDRVTIAEKIPEYNGIKVNGIKKVMDGLIKRRNAEKELFLTPYDKMAGNSIEQNESGIVVTYHTIKKGSKGEDVKYLQEYLADKGYYIGSIDSVFGSMMERSVILFQYDTGLVSDGIAGAKTWEMVGKNPELKVKVFSYAKDVDRKISANFSAKEFRCKDKSDRILIDTDFVQDKLQKIRDHFGAAVTVNSGYRTIPYNASVKGASSSYHLYGRAFDIVVKGHTPSEVAQYAQTIGINGIIQYNSFVHVDSRSAQYRARNNNGKDTKVNSF